MTCLVVAPWKTSLARLSLFDLTQPTQRENLFPHKHLSKTIIGNSLTLQLPEVMDTSLEKVLD